MAKRVKQVFKYDELCHVWANQLQEKGRTSAPGNCRGGAFGSGVAPASSPRMFFEGKDIYSYGRHYLAARIYNKRGKTFALVNADRYSVTTAKHLGCIRGSLRGLMPYFSVASVDDLQAAVKELDAAAKARIELACKRSKIESTKEIGQEMRAIREAYQKATELRTLLGKAELWPKAADLERAQKHLLFRLRRYKELNTPEQQVRRAKERAKRAEAKQRALEIKLAERIQEFRAGKYYADTLRGLQYDLLRKKEQGEIETSRGVSVSEREAKLLYCRLTKGKDVKGIQVGGYTCIGVTPLPNGDRAVKIGCHNILLSEARQVLGECQPGDTLAE